MFTLTNIRFYEGCKYMKNLHIETDYPIGHKLDKDFFAPEYMYFSNSRSEWCR